MVAVNVPTTTGELFYEFTQEAYEQQAVELLANECAGKSVAVGFSGGKDSVVIRWLTERAGVKADYIYHVTTVDPPDLVQFIREQYPDVIFDRPKHKGEYVNMFDMVRLWGLPTRFRPWCCSLFKETAAVMKPYDVCVLGVRGEESNKRRASWRVKQFRKGTQQIILLPIFNWLTENVWRCIREHNIPYCKLYDDGAERLGCVGCCKTGVAARKASFRHAPHFGQRYFEAFKVYADSHPDVMAGRSASDVFNAWMNGEPITSHCDGSINMEFDLS